MILLAPDSFKGTLSSYEAGRALALGLKRAGFPETDILALADGGEGLAEALLRARSGGKWASTPCRGPLGEKRRARFAWWPAQMRSIKKTSAHAALAALEMAASSGLPLVPEARRNPLITTTWGVGDQLRAALDRGARTILLGLGGSATNDGGAGMAQALGARLLDKSGRELEPGGAALEKLTRVDVSHLDPRLKKCKIIIACDVVNRLCGKNGASHVFGPQKGASLSDVRRLDAALANYARVLQRDLGCAVKNIPGAGAAGGLGAGCLAFLNAELKPGIELVLDAANLDERLKHARLAITGEGFLDRQTSMGKAPSGVARRAKKAGVPCIAIGGGIEASARPRLKKLFAGLESLTEFAGSKQAALARPAFWLAKLAEARAHAWLAQAGKK